MQEAGIKMQQDDRRDDADDKADACGNEKIESKEEKEPN